MIARCHRHYALAALVTCVVCFESRAQVRGGWTIEMSGVVSPVTPVVNIRVSAWFDHVPNVAELFAGGRFNLNAAESRFLPGSTRLHVLGSPGFVQDRLIHSIVVAQAHIPPQFPGNSSNPILVFSADWTTSDFTPRRVPLGTTTLAMSVFQSLSHTNSSPLHDIVEGSGFIRVVPAPGCWAALISVGWIAFRRRGWAGVPSCQYSPGRGKSQAL